MKASQPAKSDEVIYKVLFCQFSKPTFIGGNYQKTVDKIPLDYHMDKPGVRSTIELVLWCDNYLKVIAKTGKVSIVPIQNVAVIDVAVMTAEEKEKHKTVI